MILTLQVARLSTANGRHYAVLRVTSGPPDEHGWYVKHPAYIELETDGPGAGSFASGGCVLVPIET